MPYPWLCLWDRTLDTPKAQLLSGEAFKGWINLLMIANRHGASGRLPDLDQIAFGLRIDATSVKSLLDTLVKSKLIDRSGASYTMHDWDSWQANKRSSAERSREWRAQQRALSERSTEEDQERSQCSDESAQRALRARGTVTVTVTEEPPNKPPEGPVVDFVLPDWIPASDWLDWLAMRRKIRKPATPRAERLAISTLDKLREQGHEPGPVLQQSILNSWQGLFPIKPGNNGAHTAAGQGVRPSQWEDPVQKAKNAVIAAAVAKTMAEREAKRKRELDEARREESGDA